ncbi:MAG: DNA translocase FtsK, partial [Clostridiales bacterium]|nr:DNA translocase FtsK [Clostridiales bacterium]
KATGTHEQTTQSYAPAAQQNAVVVRGVKRGPGETFEFPDTIDFAPIKTDEVLYPVSENTQKQEDKIDISTIFDKPEDDKIKNDYTGYKPLDDDIPSEATLDISSANSLRVRRERTRPQKEAEPVAKAPQTPAYEFPPIDFLQNPPVVRTDDVENELRANANKITSTLESFNIHTTVVNVSRGPAVTRYEIAPEAGTKVSAIVSRAEDLSLGLASAVLIEGVIPGKSAIGIEVPNKKTSLVFLRQLIDDDEFKTAKSKLTASLGIDLTGSKIYLDIAKMPHLLIAGATGMGKSVCMNSLIVSLLYKATPDEVKFIFIDPKKVELSIYDGLPHLLVPVVSEPKKAAGALNWCVTEMERRYDLLEARGKRNVSQYNEAVEGDPTAEKLPQIVIVIDELADLMIAARDVVETSINRIAAKARAAGMHLVIGTQRPSVDVVTGTIKANIPSRIAFTMSSQVDSRTILDASGAEKLMGKGDMLYAPVGARLPFRVQGAFVDENEIEDIVSFIKEQSGGAAYDRDIAEQIEKEAEMCGKKGGKSSGQSYEADDDSSDEDPMLDAAIKLAIEEKKISTSLIQRRLSLGYGRAAKLIDAMEARGIVSEPNGQKPRDVLISYEEYLERSMHSDS